MTARAHARQRPWGSLAAWLIFAVAALRAASVSLTQDFRRHDLVADQASFLYSAMSLLHDHDLRYSATDALRWRFIDWTSNPAGLYFQMHGGQAVFAKPYGYSMWLVPFIWVFGPGRGVAVANTVLMAGLVAAVLFLVHKRCSWQVSAWVATALLLVSNVTFFALPIGVEPFYACLVAVFFLAVWNGSDGSTGWSLVAVAIAAFLVSEKQPMFLVLAPAMLLLLVRQPNWRRRAGLLGAGVAVFGLAVIPYVHYSGGKSITPYGGDRYFSYGGKTWVGPGSDAIRSQSDSMASVSYVTDQLTHDPQMKIDASRYFVLGQHTGLLVWLPMAVFVVILTLMEPRRITSYGLAALIGMGAYVAFYVLLFPSNFYGGSQSIGNRYFVQIAPVVAAVLVGGAVRSRRVIAASAASIMIVLAMLWPQLVSPRDALARIDQTSWLQDQMMFESRVYGWRAFSPSEIPPIQQPLHRRDLRPDQVPAPDVSHLAP